MSNTRNHAGLGVVREHLQVVAGLIAGASLCQPAVGRPADRAAMAIALASVAQVHELAPTGQRQRQDHSHFVVSDVYPGVEEIDIRHAHVTGHGELDVFVDIAQAGAAGLLYLSMGSSVLDFNHSGGATSSLVTQIRGSLGSTTLWLSSGMTMGAVAQAVNQFQWETGVVAYAANTGVQLESAQLGATSFVSVQTLQYGGAGPYPRGIYGLDQAGQLEFWMDFWLPIEVTGRGTDLVATVNHRTAVVHDTRLELHDHDLDLGMTLDRDLAQTEGAFLAFRIHRHE